MPTLTFQQAFELALQHHRAGRLAEAEQLYRQILAPAPAHADSLHFLGVIAYQRGQHDAAVDLIGKAIALNPSDPQYFNNLGFALTALGRLPDAIAAHRQAVALNPNYTDAIYNLANALAESGQADEAISAYRRLIALAPDLAEAHSNLGAVLNDKRQFAEAIAVCRRAIALKPLLPQAHYVLGNALTGAGQPEPAIAAYRQAIGLEPNYPDAHNNLATALRASGRIDQAIASYRAAIAFKADYADAYHNLATALRDNKQPNQAVDVGRQAIDVFTVIAANPHPCPLPEYRERGIMPRATAPPHHSALPQAYCDLGQSLLDDGQPLEAVAALRQAIALDGRRAHFHTNLGAALKDAGNIDAAIAAHTQAIALDARLTQAHVNLAAAWMEKREADPAIAACRRAIALDPDLPLAHWNLALALLARGDYPEGWREHEWRWRWTGFPSPARDFPQPQWTGQPLRGRRILLHAEQGLGDTLQFTRFVPRVLEAGAQVILECQPPLVRLMKQSFPHCVVVAQSFPPSDSDLPDFDMHCPLMSLPLVLGTDLPGIPATQYLHPNDRDIEHWRTRLADHASCFKIGLAWAGNPHHRNDRNRSLPVSHLAPLAQLPGVRLFSLQKDPPPAAAAPQLSLIDLTPRLADFADTAALIANLDLVISVDTAVAHLAGAMGKPVWTLLPFAADWRWLLDRDDSPWYPMMRLFRQSAAGDWDSVMQRVAGELRDLAHRR